MEYTDQYVYLNYKSANPIVSSLNVVLNFSTDRVPYALVEVISATLRIDGIVAPQDTFILKTKEIAQNYLGSDNNGTALGLIVYNSVLPTPTAPLTAHTSYSLVGFGARVMFANPRNLTLFFTNQAGDVVNFGGDVPSTINAYNIILKVSYPKVGEIPPVYRLQIPLPSGL
jgi:hypothetical protein